MEIKYQCQKQIQTILERIKSDTNHFEASVQYLNGLDNDTFVRGFYELREILRSVYRDMLERPDEYGLILVGLDVSEYKNSRPRDSRASAMRLMALLYNLGRAGELTNNELYITPEAFQEMAKIKYTGFSWTQNAPMILKKLSEFGFKFTGLKGASFDRKAEKYILSYPDSPALMNVLKGYAESIPVTQHFPKELMNIECYTLEDAVPDDKVSVEFSVPLKEKILLNELINNVQKDYIGVCVELIEYAISLGYMPHPTQASGFAVSFTGKKTNRTIIKLTPVTGLNHKKFIPELRIKYAAAENCSGIFREAIRKEAENFGGIYTGCFGCGKCAGLDECYKYTYTDGRTVHICSNVMLAPDWRKENLPEIKQMMKAQDEFWLR